MKTDLRLTDEWQSCIHERAENYSTKMRFKLKTLYLLGVMPLLLSCKSNGSAVLPQQKMDYIVGQFERTLNETDDPTKIPRSISNNGDLVTSGIFGWTSGFFSGSLWYLYELSPDERWKEEAIRWTEILEPVQYVTNDHDIGFMINCSYGNGYRITKNETYRKILIQAATSLSQRYNPMVKSIKSWNRKKSWDGKTIWHYPVIIDNMMNLELLFEASKLSGDPAFRNIAVEHAMTTMKNHYRKDFSSYHMVNYDPKTGEVLNKATVQGFADESSWARGQAWGLYGFVVCYRYTGNKRFLEFAENIANYILNHPELPEDLVPYWDFDVKNTSLRPEWNYEPRMFKEIPRDASAAAITCSALLELGLYSEKYGKGYIIKADEIIRSLSSPTYMDSANNKYFILNHSVGSIPHGAEIDIPLVYADYYFLEALVRKNRMQQNGNSYKF
ncbi:glycoside hydrolase family 88 protein [Muricauda sp. ANG21]|uniref:glycoside hydrolase family 88 protein n=1 Tax=Allomuricauda sp. ANG21 TaxID=3042468 RepID=UPI003453A116